MKADGRIPPADGIFATKCLATVQGRPVERKPWVIATIEARRVVLRVPAVAVASNAIAVKQDLLRLAQSGPVEEVHNLSVIRRDCRSCAERQVGSNRPAVGGTRVLLPISELASAWPIAEQLSGERRRASPHESSLEDPRS